MAKYSNKEVIPIFDGNPVDGYGDAIKQERRSSYNWNYNWDDRFPGRSVPALAPTKYAAVSAINYKQFSWGFKWEDATTLRPFVITGSGAASIAETVILRDGAISADGEDASSSAPVTGGVLFRHDGSDVDAEMAYFARAGTIIWQRNKAGTYADTDHTISPYGIYVVGSDLWIVAANGYEIQKWTLDTDPGLSGSYGTAIPVGRPSYPVNFIANLGGSPLPIKGDGIFKYDPSTSVAQFVSVLDFSSPDKDNGLVVAQDGRGRIYVTTVEGHIVVVTAGFQNSHTPTRKRVIDRDTPYGRITALATDLDDVYAAIEPGQRYTEQLGLTVIADDGGVRTNETADVTDGKFGTVADVTLLATGDFIYIGADEPFLGAYIFLNTICTGGPTKILTVGYSSAAETFTAAANSHDSTGFFTRDGLITLQVAGNTDLYAGGTGPWIKTTAYTGSASKYWMRLSFSGTGSLAGTTIAEVRIVPYRPPLDTALFPETAYAIGGALVPILAGHWEGEELVWHHVWTLDSARIEKMVVASGYCGALPTKRALYCFDAGGNGYGMPIGPDAHPARAAWPKLADYGESSVAFDAHARGFSAIDFGGVVQFSGGIEIDMTAVQSDDTVAVYCKWDEDQTRGYQKLADHHGRKHFITSPPTGMGRILYTSLQYSDGSRTAMAPILRGVNILPGSWDYVPDATIQEANYPSPAES